ncbi:MAG: DUF389 domain-containing protein [Paludibacteraceae bacterium]
MASENKILKYLRYFDLRNELESFDKIQSDVEKGIVFKGTNLWILICAILVASVGLNMNSTAVIIGAMLISPLMGPINGMGYGLATYDFLLFKRSIKNYIFAVVVSLLTSALYFVISPVSTAHSELLARTSPTIYDVFIALFGGVAGMLALSSKLKGNVIPGVAIATALMPPICTAGYGLAKLDFNFFFGALYLFTINTVFIAVAALLVAQILKFPIRTIVDTDRAKQVNRYITLILFITAVPSVFFGAKLVKDEKFNDAAKRFVNSVTVQEKSYLLESSINSNARSIQLIYSGYGISDSAKLSLKDVAYKMKLDSSKLTILSGTDESQLHPETQRKLAESQTLSEQMVTTTFALQQAQVKLDSINRMDSKGKTILAEVKQFYPQITTCAYTETYIHPDTLKTPIVIYTSDDAIGRADRNKIINWTRSRVNNENATVYFE